jgi:hypothetical protein
MGSGEFDELTSKGEELVTAKEAVLKHHCLGTSYRFANLVLE